MTPGTVLADLERALRQDPGNHEIAKNLGNAYRAAGDLVLAATPGTDFRGPWEIPEHRAGHGSIIAEHMEVPIAASVALPDAPLRTVDLMPTILECLDVPVPSGVVLDGVPFSKIAAATEPLVR